jgi:hypothetical protein
MAPEMRSIVLDRNHPPESTMQMPTHEQIANLAYQLWQQRGCPDGSPEVDWERAMRVLEDPPGGDNAIVGFADTGSGAGTAAMGAGSAGAQALPDDAGKGGARQNSTRRPARRSA